MKKLIATILLTSILLPHFALANTHEVQFTRSANQYARYAPDSASLSFTSDFTIEYWVKFDSFTGSYPFSTVSKYGGGSNQRAWDVGYGDNAGTKMFVTTISSDGTGANTVRVDTNYAGISTGIWYHVAYVYTASAGTIDVYVADENSTTHTLVGTATGHKTSVFNSSSPFWLAGAEGGGSNVYFDGHMDDVRAWGVAKTASALDAAFCGELTGAESNLAGYWKLDNNYTDSTANANNLTAVNTPTFSTSYPSFTNCVASTGDPIQKSIQGAVINGAQI